MSHQFPKPFRNFGGNINIKVDLSNYATKTDLKNVTHIDTSSFALKTNLPNLKTVIDKLNIDKLEPVPVDLSKLSDVVKNDVVKKTVCDKLVAKVDNIDTSDIVLKSLTLTKQNQKIKFLILVVLLKREITILKLLKQKVKFLILVIQQQNCIN